MGMSETLYSRFSSILSILAVLRGCIQRHIINGVVRRKVGQIGCRLNDCSVLTSASTQELAHSLLLNQSDSHMK